MRFESSEIDHVGYASAGISFVRYNERNLCGTFAAAVHISENAFAFLELSLLRWFGD
jgi:hypothetical protein